MKNFIKSLLILGIILFILGVSIFVSGHILNIDALIYLGITLIFTGSFSIFSWFIVSFKKTMIDEKTYGDPFTLMSKQSLIQLLDKFEIEYEKDKGKEYYLYLVRENIEQEIK